MRQAIDFPLISVALRFDLSRDDVDATVTKAVVCVGALAAKPKLVKADVAVGQTLSDPAMHVAWFGKMGALVSNAVQLSCLMH